MAGRFSVRILDRLGNYAPAVNGVLIPGQAIGVHNVRLNPTGGVLDKIGTVGFSVPLSVWRNLAIKVGASVEILDADLNNAVVAEAKVGPRSVKVANDGVTADITCYDQLDELRRVTVTSGFVTSPGETNAATLARLVGKQRETVWTFDTDLGTAYDGLAFTAAGSSVAQAIGKYSTERYSHFKRSGHRNLSVGHFGGVSGVVLGQAGQNPTRTATENTAWRQILDGGLVINEDANYVNSLVLTGAGAGIAQLTLRVLYNTVGEKNLGGGVFETGPISFVGYDGVNHPIRRRPSDNPGQVVGGYEYFIQDQASIDQYGEFWDGWQEAGIAPAGTAPADFVNAAQALYNAGVAHLGWNSNPHEEYTITTLGNGDWRNLAGQTVRVVYRGVAKTKEGAFINLDLNRDLVLMEVMLSEEASGKVSAACTVSNLGKYATSNTSVLISTIQQVEYGHFTAATYPGGYPLTFNGVADKDHPLVRTYPGNGGTTQVLEAKISLYVIPARLPARPKFHGHNVVTGTIPHDVGRDESGNATPVPHDVNGIPHDVAFAAAGNYEFSVGGAGFTRAGVDYNPGTKMHIAGGPPPGSAKVLMYDPSTDNFYFQTGGSAKDGSLNSQDLNIHGATSTTDGTGGTVKATTGATGGKVKSTSSGTGGVTQVKTHHYVEGSGGSAASFNDDFADSGASFDPAATGVGSGAQGEVGMEWGHFENPAPLPSVQVLIGDTVVGTVSGIGKLDITDAVTAHGGAATDFDFTLIPAAAGGNGTGLCEMYGVIQTRTILAAIGKPGGVI